MLAKFSVDTYIALASLLLNLVVAATAISIAYLALVHTAKPRIRVVLHGSLTQPCARLVAFHYELINRGYWYALPPAIDITVYCDFDPRFEVIGFGYGSVQEVIAAEVRKGKGGRQFVKAKGIKLIANDLGELIRVHVRTPNEPGLYEMRVSAYSANGLSHFEQYELKCVSSAT